jgi:hypothetical protein
LDTFVPHQKCHTVLWGEKTSIGHVVRRFGSYKADLFLPSGESTDSQLWLMAKVGADDGRAMIVFVVADFDPRGNQMSGRLIPQDRKWHFRL